MSWKIEWHPNAFKNFEALQLDIKERIMKRVNKIQENPFHFLEHYEGQNYYKLRIGDYRALVDIDFGNKIIKIRVFDHRKRIYKNV